MKIAICDNERKFIENIEKHIHIYAHNKGINLQVYSFASSHDLLLCNARFDIAVLDTELDGVDGIKLGRLLKYRNPNIVLMYISSQRSSIDDVFELNALRFFEKPVDSNRFYKGLESAIKSVDQSNVYFFLKKDNGESIKTKVNISDIVYVEIENRKSKIVTKRATYYSIDNIDYWRNNLISSYFISPHKSFIINMNYITAYSRDFVRLDDEYFVPVSRNNKTWFKNTVEKYMDNKICI